MDALHDAPEPRVHVLPGKGLRETEQTQRIGIVIAFGPGLSGHLPAKFIPRHHVAEFGPPDLSLRPPLGAEGDPFFRLVERNFKGPCRRDPERIACNASGPHRQAGQALQQRPSGTDGSEHQHEQRVQGDGVADKFAQLPELHALRR